MKALRLAAEPADEGPETMDLLKEPVCDAGADAVGHGERSADLLELALVHPLTVANKCSTVLAWCEPPPAAPVWVRRLQPLLDHPGAWALVRTGFTLDAVTSCAAGLRRSDAGKESRTGNRRRRDPQIPVGRWQFRAGALPAHLAVELEPDRFGVWARYLGAGDA